MNLEISLVKVAQVGNQAGDLIARNRYIIDNDTQAVDTIAKFIAENISQLSIAITDGELINKLRDLSNLTITDLLCLKYVIAQITRMELWWYYVSDSEINESDLPDGVLEFLVLDHSNTIGSFIPFCTKIQQFQNDYSMYDLFFKVNEMYGLFTGNLFSSMNNPLSAPIRAIKDVEQPLGVVPKSSSSYIYSVLELLQKEIRIVK